MSDQTLHASDHIPIDDETDFTVEAENGVLQQRGQLKIEGNKDLGQVTVE